MPIRGVGLHVINFFHIHWDPELPRPDPAVESAKQFLLGKQVAVLQDGKIMLVDKVEEGLSVFDYDIDLSREENSDFISRFEQNVFMDNGLFRVNRPGNPDSVRMIISGKFGDQFLVASDDGFLCIKSLRDHFRETNPLDGIPQT